MNRLGCELSAREPEAFEPTVFASEVFKPEVFAPEDFEPDEVSLAHDTLMPCCTPGTSRPATTPRVAGSLGGLPDREVTEAVGRAWGVLAHGPGRDPSRPGRQPGGADDRLPRCPGADGRGVAGGHYRTGDLAVRDEDGHLHHTGRIGTVLTGANSSVWMAR
ncbi:hypothetical protein HHL19_14490 [Streptomyces sp. R302]|uniref:hypothetical protein n=1 Tax=unclassified Streptomyces TaxID=2593676 RepID=UPI00145ED1D9|nr:hypothetical protein [Streptomyces sp. R301]NML79857.1 hypothetical protein [Streptomyces sp. R302]